MGERERGGGEAERERKGGRQRGREGGRERGEDDLAMEGGSDTRAKERRGGGGGGKTGRQEALGGLPIPPPDGR